MRHQLWLVALLIAAMLGSTATAQAETRYISDQLVVSLRPAPQDSAAALTYLKTDTPVEVLEEGDRYTKVRTAEGQTGYIQSSYLTADTPKSTLIRRLRADKARLEEQVAKLEQRYQEAFSQDEGTRRKLVADLQSAQQQVAELQTELAATNQQLEDITTAYETLRENSQNVTAITAERDRLQELQSELAAEVDRLRQTNDRLTSGNQRRWFLAGAGVLLLGWLLGKLSRTKRKSRF